MALSLNVSLVGLREIVIYQMSRDQHIALYSNVALSFAIFQLLYLPELLLAPQILAPELEGRFNTR